MQNEYRSTRKVTNLTVMLICSIAFNVAIFIGLCAQTKQTAKAREYNDLLRVHATEFAIAWADTAQDYPELSHDELMAIARVRAFGTANDPNPLLPSP